MYNIVYTEDVNQVVAAVIIDARAIIMPSGIDGNQVQVYIDQAVAKINDNTLVYKIEVDSGTLVGYFTLQVNRQTKVCVRDSIVVRPAYQSLIVGIISVTDQFITSNDWHNDILF